MEPVKIEIYISKETRPEFNLALEEYLFITLSEKSDRILFYRNRPSVIIGKHQNPWQESNLPFLKENKIPLLRRFSGGGAVYHDEGNINFSFITTPERHRPGANLKLLCKALNTSGIDVTIGEKHNLMVNQQKISGSAFAIKKRQALHHGTLLINADLRNMKVALKPTFEHIQTRSTQSVRAGVINLNEARIDIRPEQMILTLSDFYARQYHRSETVKIKSDAIRRKDLGDIITKYTTREWNFGYTPYFEYRFAINSTQQIQLDVKEGRIIQIHGPLWHKNQYVNQPFSVEAVKKIQNVAGLAALSA